ncbi:MAG: type VI secretion system baseplate subunit TssF [Paracoccus sp. (in: a-proteobacteria)]|uniref:type VI secretion system baseplate subunit TssF n=1 Tax=Paracoccus sp. TaxID=267 RepID=UPI0026E0B785|nr:type VI secretion system baseplate subunit TssF [Paracoccus sp. (in: a-proteobacteria)]MDO5611859.1 type VI secretion system baseplate subunit TssF [Paracoccus sp. (in: a-proteobacteria)]
MANRFLNFYNEELDALRSRAQRFADAFPKIAGRLRLSREVSDDPHVERLVQSFAWSAARIRQKLDDSLPELSDALLETLYPHYLAPLPSMTVVGFTPSPAMDAVQTLPRGTEILSGQIEGDQVRFAITQDVELAPLRIAAVQMMNRPVEAPARPGLNAAGALRLTLAPTGKARLADLGVSRLRLYLAGAHPQAMALFQLLHQSCTGVSLALHGNDDQPHHLPPGALKPSGHAADQALLPWPDAGFRGYRTLTEFFALPEKFLFFDLETGPLTGSDRQDIYIYFSQPPGALERQVDLSSFALFASPAVNLFPSQAEPITLDGSRSLYPLMADARRPATRAVHSVRHVTLASDNGQLQPAKPYFHRLTERRAEGVFWQIRRHADDPGLWPGATSLAFVDSRNQALPPNHRTASVQVLATNADLPRKLPFGGGQPRLSMRSGSDHVAAVACLIPPTAPRRVALPEDRAWGLISHLSLNHQSLTGDGVEVLRNILRLYDPGDSRETARLIDAIAATDARPGFTRMGQVMLPGTDITLTFDADAIDPATAVFFGAMLDRFLGCYTTLNSFTRLMLKQTGRSDILASFAPRAGEEALI